LTTSRDNLTKSETVTIAAIEGGVPLLVGARGIIAGFHRMIRRKAENELAPWIDWLAKVWLPPWQWRCERHTSSPSSDRLTGVQRTN
jgi:hypothetical protein